MKRRTNNLKTRRNDIEAKCRNAAHAHGNAARRAAAGKESARQARPIPSCTCPRCGRSTLANMFVCPHCGACIAMPHRECQCVAPRDETGSPRNASGQENAGASGMKVASGAKRQRYLSEEVVALLAASIPQITVA